MLCKSLLRASHHYKVRNRQYFEINSFAFAEVS